MANQVAYGFETLASVFDQRVDQVGVRDITDALQRSFDEHNRVVNAMLGLFVRETTDYQLRYRAPGARRLQPADEFARALPTRRAGYYDLAFPLQKGQDAFGYTYEALRKLTVQELNIRALEMQQADRRWMRDHMLAALLDNTTWTFTDEDHGALTIQPLANGDSTTYQVLTGADSGATDNHFIAQTAAIADATNPLDDISDELLEHPENAGEVVVFAPTGTISAIRGLANFVPLADPNIAVGANTDRLVGALGVAVPGEIIGYADGVWIAHWRYLPSNTLVGVTTEGEPPLGMRQHPEAELQGFREDDARADYPWYERQYSRRAGFGAWNRVGAVVYQVSGGDTTYDIPTGYTNPIP